MPMKIFPEKGFPQAEPDSSATSDTQFKKNIFQVKKISN